MKTFTKKCDRSVIKKISKDIERFEKTDEETASFLRGIRDILEGRVTERKGSFK